jgi:hypothetical protein
VAVATGAVAVCPGWLAGAQAEAKRKINKMILYVFIEALLVELNAPA